MQYYELEAGLRIIGNDFDPVLITQALEITPTRCWKKGDIHPASGTEYFSGQIHIRKFSLWCMAEKCTGSLDSNDVIRPIYDIFFPKKKTLKLLSKEWGTRIELDVVPCFAANTVIGMFFEPKVIDFLSYIKARIPIDIYSLFEEDSEYDDEPYPYCSGYSPEDYIPCDIEGMLKITGDNFDPEAITQALQIVPTESYKKGDKSLTGSVIHETSFWCLKIKRTKSGDSDDVVIPIYKMFFPKKAILRSLIEKLNLNIVLEVVPYFFVDHDPGIYFPPKVINFLSSVKGAINVEFHCMRYSDTILPNNEVKDRESKK